MLALLLCLYRQNSRAKRSRSTALPRLSRGHFGLLHRGFYLCLAARPIGICSALGALLFFASDVIIGFGQVGGIRPAHADDWIWWLYPLGQMLLIGGLWV